MAKPVAGRKTAESKNASAPAKTVAPASKRVLIQSVGEVKCYYNPESRKFEAEVNGQMIERATPIELEVAIERLATGKRVLLVSSRGVRQAVLIGRSGSNYVFGDGTISKEGAAAVFPYSDALFKEYLSIFEARTKARKEYESVVDSLNSREGKATEGVDHIALNSVNEVDRVTRKRAAAPAAETPSPDEDEDESEDFTADHVEIEDDEGDEDLEELE